MGNERRLRGDADIRTIPCKFCIDTTAGGGRVFFINLLFGLSAKVSQESGYCPPSAD